ncbi:GntR family transcriptional regulator [Rhizobium sp. AU243]|uniref:GntR family transcriptional regulator n=1 Tax=Rhizobium sp. AU243 TaxID=2303425 RepID=UPI0010CC1293|nr:GntR family transcriptional regulator [Rhizobium sp. AU243]TKV70561.1 GntR family transcriptional regulator [Rhizobium sp. AU243]
MKSPTRSINRVDTLVRRLADDIQDDQIGHGAWLKQFDLADRYEVNRLTVRSALDKLVARGLVEHMPNRGYKVRSINPSERRDLLEIRALMEISAAASIVENAKLDDISELRDLARSFSCLTEEEGNFLALIDANLLFHRRLLSINSNRQIPLFVDEIRAKMARGQNTKWKSIASLTQSALEHHKMIDAIEARSAVDLENLLRQHILTT